MTATIYTGPIPCPKPGSIVLTRNAPRSTLPANPFVFLDDDGVPAGGGGSENGDGEPGNETPGYWNHVVCVIDGGRVIEAQMFPGLIPDTGLPKDTPGQVIGGTWDAIDKRYPHVAVFEPRNVDDDDVESFILVCVKQLGIKYAPKVTVRKRHIINRVASDGHNCVSVARLSWAKAFGRDPGWRKPDSVSEDGRRLVKVAQRGEQRPQS